MRFSFIQHLTTACLTSLAASSCLMMPAQAGQATASASTSHDATESPVTLPDSHTFTLQTTTGEEYRILVALPPGPPPAQGYATLAVLDGNAYFAAMAEAMRSLQAFPKVYSKKDIRTAQPTMVVGIAYPGDAVLDGQRRSWDFLPPSSHAEDIERLRGEQPGGAAAFLDFLTEELRPALAMRYPLHDTQHTLAGHSLGGYFVLYALTHRPDAFQRYAAISPATWWDNHHILSDLAQRPLGNTSLMLAIAKDEWPAYQDYSSAMLAQARAVRDTLTQRGLDTKTLQYREVADEDHMTIPFAMMAAITRFAALP